MIMMPRVQTAADVKESGQAAAVKTCRFESPCSWLYDAAFLKHVAWLLSDPDRSRARSRLHQQGLLALLPRLRNRAAERRFLVGAEPPLELLADPRVVLGGASAAQVFSWELTDGSWPVEAYVAETHLVALMEQYGLERDERSADLVLRSVLEPWPFPPQVRVAPAVVAVLDLAEASDVRLVELTGDVVADWLQPSAGRTNPSTAPNRVPSVCAQRRAGLESEQRTSIAGLAKTARQEIAFHLPTSWASDKFSSEPVPVAQHRVLGVVCRGLPGVSWRILPALYDARDRRSGAPRGAASNWSCRATCAGADTRIAFAISWC
jgi:hypothetical protein